MEGQHTGSFPRVCSERSANSRAPGHLVGLGDSPALPCGWDSFPRQWQVAYPLAGLFSSPGHCSPSPCCPPAALSRRSRSRSAGWGVRSRLPLPSAGGAGPVLTAGSHNNPRPAGRAEGMNRGAGVPLCPSVLGGRWVPRAAKDTSCPVRGGDPRVPSGGSLGQRSATPAATGRVGVSAGGGRYPRCPMAARART